MALSSKKTRDKAAEGRGGGVLRIPQGVKTLKIDKAGTIKMVILPYTVPQGAKHPVAKDGELHYARDYYVHNNLGSDGKGYAICPKLTKGGKCPICDGISAAIDSGELTKETAKKFYAKQRTLYTVWLPEQNQVVLFDHSYHLFSKQLNTTVSAKVAIPGREWIDYFADPIDGAFIYVTFAEKVLPGNKCYEAVSFDFDRHGGVPDAILAQALQLDNLLVIESAETLKAKFYDEDPEDFSDATAETAASDTVVADVKSTPAPAAPAVKLATPTVPPSTTKTTQRPPVVVTTTQRPPVVVTTKPPEQAAPSEWPVAGEVVYHPTFGQCTVVRNNDGMVILLDSASEPKKSAIGQLSREPLSEATEAVSTVEEAQSQSSEDAPPQASGADDDQWDSTW